MTVCFVANRCRYTPLEPEVCIKIQLWHPFGGQQAGNHRRPPSAASIFEAPLIPAFDRFLGPDLDMRAPRSVRHVPLVAAALASLMLSQLLCFLPRVCFARQLQVSMSCAICHAPSSLASAPSPHVLRPLLPPCASSTPRTFKSSPLARSRSTPLSTSISPLPRATPPCCR